MEYLLKRPLLAMFLLFLACIASVWLFVYDFNIHFLNLTTNEASNIANSINGLTAPVFSFFTLIAAVFALYRWIDEKIFDVDTQGYANTVYLYRSFAESLDLHVDKSFFTAEQWNSFYEGENRQDQYIQKLAKCSSYIEREKHNREFVEKLLLLSVKVMKRSKDNDLKLLYGYYYYFQNNITSEIRSYLSECVLRDPNHVQIGSMKTKRLDDDEFLKIEQVVNSNFLSVHERIKGYAENVNKKFLNNFKIDEINNKSI